MLGAVGEGLRVMVAVAVGRNVGVAVSVGLAVRPVSSVSSDWPKMGVKAKSAGNPLTTPIWRAPLPDAKVTMGKLSVAMGAKRLATEALRAPLTEAAPAICSWPKSVPAWRPARSMFRLPLPV